MIKIAFWFNIFKSRPLERDLEDCPVLKFICQLSVEIFDFFHLPPSTYYGDTYNEWPVYRVVFTRAMGIKKNSPQIFIGKEKKPTCVSIISIDLRFIMSLMERENDFRIMLMLKYFRDPGKPFRIKNAN